MRSSQPGKVPKNIFPLIYNQEKWIFKDNKFDCIINNLNFHSIENLESFMRNINKSLIPDGCFLGNFYTSSSFQELKYALNLAENEREGGVSPNSLIFPHISDVGNLMQRLHFSLPSINVHKYRYKFHNLSQIFEFLTLIGETNFLINKRKFKRRDTFISAMAIYENLFNEASDKQDEEQDIRTIKIDLRDDCQENKSYVYLTIDISSFICWKYHESQQKPKERGSSKFSLKELANEALENESDPTLRVGKIIQKPGSEDFEIIEITEKIKSKIKDKLGEEELQKIIEPEKKK
jgi:NADH dehydrogenase [ubiquinone] 1 alpha subcomplex assembly factor 5